MNVLFSFKQLRTLLAMLAMMIFSFPDAVADAPSLIIKDLGEGHCLVQINTNQRYLLLPVEEVMPDVRVSMIVNNKEVRSDRWDGTFRGCRYRRCRPTSSPCSKQQKVCPVQGRSSPT